MIAMDTMTQYAVLYRMQAHWSGGIIETVVTSLRTVVLSASVELQAGLAFRQAHHD